MRIQHNIMAMNAYRNYNNNTSALSKNLERLSSGYKINRAGDDAAGLAISEKMRAQITGLDAAQKNVKDGISLVNTAEGAMQEIQDMLNRMVYLATQSSNGTYDNEVDRKNLQQEVDQLKEEINRIADSANFNGIKLLDGSLDTNADLSASADFTIGGDLPEVGQTIGVNTVLHNDADGTSGTEFSVELHNFHMDLDAGNTMTMKVGDTVFELTVDDDAAGGELKGEDLAKALAGDTTNKTTLLVDGKAVTYDPTNGTKVSIGGKDFTMKANGSKLTFVQDKPPATKDDQVDGSMKVSITGATADVKAEVTIEAADLQAKIDDGTLAAGSKLKVAGTEITLDNTNLATGNALAAAIQAAVAADTNSKFTAELDGTDVVLTAKEAGKVEAPAVSVSKAANATASAAATKTVEGKELIKPTVTQDTGVTQDPNNNTTDGSTGTQGDWNWTYHNDGTSQSIDWVYNGTETDPTVDIANPTGGDAVHVTAAVAAEHQIDLSDWDGTSKLKIGANEYATIDEVAAAIEGTETNYNVAVADGVITLTAKTPGAAGTTGPADPATANTTVTYGTAASETALAGIATVTKEGKNGGDLEGITEGSNGDWNVSTTDIKNVTAEGVDRLASTYFDLTDDIASEGSQLRIGDNVYTFTSDKDKIASDPTKYVDISSGDLDKIAKNLTDVAAASNNAVYSVGHDPKRRTSMITRF